MVEQAQLELQLKVWKELAISKQMLMRTAAEALKLDPNCSQEELKAALEAALKKVAEADASVVTGAGLQFKRDARGAYRCTILEEEDA